MQSAVTFGFPEKLKVVSNPEQSGPRVCARCHNGTLGDFAQTSALKKG